jgi:uncharacterized membrane protein
MSAESHNLAELIKQLRDDTSELIREEVKLAATETKENVSKAARNAGYLAAGGLVAYAALVVILLGVGFLIRQSFVERGMGEGAATFLGLLIVGLVVGAIGGVLIAKALNTFKSESLAPTRTVRSLQEDKQWAQSKIS